MNNELLYERYQRQMILEGFGAEAQQQLLDAKILVVGAGGLGCPLLQYLVAAGAGTIGIVDDDVVSISNLQRQVLFSADEIGLAKVICAERRLKQLNPHVQIKVYNQRVTTANAVDLFSAYDIIADGSDNFATRYLINDACVLLNKTLVHGAVSKFEGQLAVFNAVTGNELRSANYRDLFPQPPGEDILNCEEAGVLGVTPGIIGTMMALEIIKLVTGLGKPLVNQLLTYNVLSHQSYILKIKPKEETRKHMPADINTFQQTNYEWLCHSSTDVFEIDSNQFNQLIKDGKSAIIDVREKDELPVVTDFNHLQIPLNSLEQHAAWLEEDTLVVFCLSGKRSAQAAKRLRDMFGTTKNIYSLKDGIQKWVQEKKEII